MTTTIDTETPIPAWADTVGEWVQALPVDGDYQERCVSRQIGPVTLSAYQEKHADGRLVENCLQAHVEATYSESDDATPQEVADGLTRLMACVGKTWLVLSDSFDVQAPPHE